MSRFTGGVIGPRSAYTAPSRIVSADDLRLFNSEIIVEMYCWGAGGAGGTVGGWSFGAVGGAGGAAVGWLPLRSTTTFLIMVGGPGIVNSFANPAGGGSAASNNNTDNRYSGGGGGLSGVFYNSIGYSQAGALLIAGGGGGGGSSRAGTGNAGGGGGGELGETGASPYDSKIAYSGQPGTQSAAGANATSDGANGGGGQAALQGGVARTNSYGGGGGGGYWGGSAGGYSEANTMAGGGGGSGFVKTADLLTYGLFTARGTTPGNSTNSLRGSYGAAGTVAGNGTQGVVIFRYFGPQRGIGGTVTTSGNYTVHTFTTTGSQTITLSV